MQRKHFPIRDNSAYDSAKIQRRDATEIVRSRYPDCTCNYAAVTSTQPRSPLQTTNSQPGKHIHSNEAIDGEDKMEAEHRGSKRTLEDPTLQPGRSDTSTGGDGCSRGRTEVVCQSPKSGRIFTTSINLHETMNESVQKIQVREVMGKYSDPHNEGVQGQCGKDENQDMTVYKNESRANKQEKSDKTPK